MSTKIPVAPLGSPSSRADDFEVFSAPSLVRFLSRGVQPPSQIYLKHTDVLQVGCASSQANESVTFSYRLLRADGALIKGQFIVQVPATRVIVTQQEPMAEGFLLSLSCKAAVAGTRGQTFVRVFLTSGALGPGQPSYMLMADYVTTAMAPAHPNGRVLAPSEGPGWTRVLTQNALGPGTSWLFPVPSNARWRIVSFYASYTTDATAGNRFVDVFIIIATARVFHSFSSVVQAPSTTFTYTGANAPLVTSPGPNFSTMPLPNNITIGGLDQIGVETSNAHVGDQWTIAQLAVEEWLDNV